MLDFIFIRSHTIHMKRTNVVLADDVLEEATRVLGVKTYSAAINMALEEAIRVKKIRNMAALFGTDLWQGNLAEMREDAPIVDAAKA